MLNEIAFNVHQDARRKGFWGDPETMTEMLFYPASAGEKALERNPDGTLTDEFKEWAFRQLVQGRNFGELLMLIVTEVGEAMEEWRDGWDISTQYVEHPTEIGGRCSVLACEVGGKPVGIPSELADVIIRVLDICGAYGIDIDKALEAKIKYNATRPRLHGRVR